DYEMPGEDGLELLASVRETHPDLPFVLFTGEGSESVASDAISAGVTDYLQKGSGTEQYTILANRISNAVSRRRATESVDRQRH
ncbi:MAG: response regulator, partial [Halobaculum sp.]